jgi:hypothetical protein
MQHRRHDGRRISRAVTAKDARLTLHATRFPGRFPVNTWSRNAREYAWFVYTQLPEIQKQFVQENVDAKRAQSTREHEALLAALLTIADTDSAKRQPWRGRPLRTGAGPPRTRAAGSLTPCLLL